MIDKTSATKRQIDIPNYTEGTHIATEYGCRYPDGRQEWNTWSDYSNVGWGYASIIAESDKPYDTNAAERWGKTLRRRADEAKIDPVSYAEDHVFIKRTVILVTTKAEDVA